MKQTTKEWNQENHDFIMKFLLTTENHFDNITGSMKAIICQFLHNTRRGLALIAKKNGLDSISNKQLIEIQIKELRRCIVDLQTCFNNDKDTIQ